MFGLNLKDIVKKIACFEKKTVSLHDEADSIHSTSGCIKNGYIWEPPVIGTQQENKLTLFPGTECKICFTVYNNKKLKR